MLSGISRAQAAGRGTLLLCAFHELREESPLKVRISKVWEGRRAIDEARGPCVFQCPTQHTIRHSGPFFLSCPGQVRVHRLDDLGRVVTIPVIRHEGLDDYLATLRLPTDSWPFLWNVHASDF